MQDYMTSIGADPIALSHVLDTLVDTPREALATVNVPTLVVAGQDDTARGSVEELAAVLPRGGVRRVPGDHLSALPGAGLPRRDGRISHRRVAVGVRPPGRTHGFVTMMKMHYSELVCGWWLRL